jgi:hypothetical protein
MGMPITSNLSPETSINTNQQGQQPKEQKVYVVDKDIRDAFERREFIEKVTMA